MLEMTRDLIALRRGEPALSHGDLVRPARRGRGARLSAQRRKAASRGPLTSTASRSSCACRGSARGPGLLDAWRDPREKIGRQLELAGNEGLIIAM